MVTAGKIKAEYEGTHYDMRPSAILIDAIGLGAGVYDRCKIGIARESYQCRRGCSNARELHAPPRRVVVQRQGLVPGTTWLNPTRRRTNRRADSAYLHFTSTGKMVVESKADMKKRGMRSPDLADAFLLTFAGGEQRKTQLYRRPVRKCSAWAA